MLQGDRIVDIPDKIDNRVVTSVACYTFNQCSNIISIEIPDSVTSIDKDNDVSAFTRCSELKSINVSENNLNYSSNNGILYDKSKKELICYPKAVIGDAKIPDGVTCISRDAFNGCSSLTSIEIPDSVISIERYGFSGCSSLKSINVSENNLNYSNINGILCSKDKKNLIYCPKAITGNVKIPNSVTCISIGAFAGCSSLTGLEIPDSVIDIVDYTFNGCDNLIISGNKKSVAESYAKSHNIPFKVISEENGLPITPEESIPTGTPKDQVTTGTPKESITTGTPESGDTNGIKLIVPMVMGLLVTLKLRNRTCRNKEIK